MVLQNKKEYTAIKENVLELYRLEKKYKNVKKQYEETKTELCKNIKNFMYCNKGANEEISFSFLLNQKEKEIYVKRIVPKSIIWDIEKIEERIPKEQVKKIIDKTYEIVDMEGLTEYLKQCGVNPKKFKSFLEVSKKINTEELEQACAIGEIDKSDLSGCYTIAEKNSYLKMNIMEDKN